LSLTNFRAIILLTKISCEEIISIQIIFCVGIFYASDFGDTTEYHASNFSMQNIICVGIFYASNYFVDENIMRVTLLIPPNIMQIIFCVWIFYASIFGVTPKYHASIVSVQNIICVGIFYASDFIDTTEYFASNNFVGEIFMRVFLESLPNIMWALLLMLPNIMQTLLVCKLYFVLEYFMRVFLESLPNIMRALLLMLPNIMHNIFCVGIFYASYFGDTSKYYASNNFVDGNILRVILAIKKRIVLTYLYSLE
jgi:hypothetical protein